MSKPVPLLAQYPTPLDPWATAAGQVVEHKRHGPAGCRQWLPGPVSGSQYDAYMTPLTNSSPWERY